MSVALVTARTVAGAVDTVGFRRTATERRRFAALGLWFGGGGGGWGFGGGELEAVEVAFAVVYAFEGEFEVAVGIGGGGHFDVIDFIDEVFVVGGV